MFNIDIGEPTEEVTLAYLRSLPMFGSAEWLTNEYSKEGTRALFCLDLYSKEEMLELFIKLREILLVETLPPRAKEANDTFRFVGVNVKE